MHFVHVSLTVAAGGVWGLYLAGIGLGAVALGGEVVLLLDFEAGCRLLADAFCTFRLSTLARAILCQVQAFVNLDSIVQPTISKEVLQYSMSAWRVQTVLKLPDMDEIKEVSLAA